MIFIYVHFYSYVAYSLINLVEGVTSEDVSAILSSPKALFETVKYLNETGTWSIGRNSGAVVNGIFLSLIWVCEHLIITGCTVAGIINGDIYIESMDCWAEEKPFETTLAPLPETIKESLEQKDFLPLEQAS